MVRVSNTIISLVLVGEATWSAAMRTGLANQGTVGQMMKQMRDLRKGTRAGEDNERLNKFQALAQITPGAQESLKNALSSVITDIDKNVIALISDAHKDTQTEIDNRIHALKLSTTKTSDQKTNADAADKQWLDCVEDEKQKRIAVETATSALRQAQQDLIKPCQDRDASSAFSTAADELSFSCDFSKHENCPVQLQNFKTQIANLIAGVKSDMQQKEATYAGFKAECAAKQTAMLDAKQALSDSTAAWQSKREQCISKHEDRGVSICLFGSALHGKCSAIAAYDSLMLKIDAEGSVYSHQDRVEEWETATITKCMLDAVANGKQIDQAALTTCEQSLDFGGAIGVLEKYKASYDASTSSDKYPYTCAAESVKFFGSTWEVPQGDAPSSSDYIQHDFAPNFRPAGEFPFALCSPSGQPAYESRPEGKCATYQDKLPGAALGSNSHSTVMSLEFHPESSNATKRQWILNIGQSGAGAEHWLWNAHAGENRVQFGRWNGGQIGVAEINNAKVIATTYDSSTLTYKLYVDGALKAERTQSEDQRLDIKNGDLKIGLKGYNNNEIGFEGCGYGVDIYRRVLTAEQIVSAAQNLPQRTWLLGAPGQSCDQTCQHAERTCAEDGWPGWAISSSSIEAVAEEVGAVCKSVRERCDKGEAPLLDNGECGFCTTQKPQCRKRYGTRTRLCPCL